MSSDHDTNIPWIEAIHEAKRRDNKADIAYRVLEALKIADTSAGALTDEQRALLTDASMHVLSLDLQALLRKLLLLDIATDLVRLHKCDINSVARALPNDLAGVDKPAVEALSGVLETRGFLLNHASDESLETWFKTLCKTFPTVASVQRQEWETLTATIDQDGKSVSSCARPVEVNEAIRKLWSTGNELREVVHRYELPPSVAEKLSRQGFKTMHDVPEPELKELLRGLSSSDMGKVRKMWRCESAEGKAEYRSAAKKREEKKRQTEDAIKITNELIEKASTPNKVAIEATATRFQDATAKLGLSEWKVESTKTEDPELLAQSLTNLSKVLSQAVGELDAVAGDEYETDEKIIARASGGLALYGLSFGLSKADLGKRAKKPLLRQPDFCPLASPEWGGKVDNVIFSSVEAGSNYCSMVKSSGESLTASLKASGWEFGVEGSHAHSCEQSARESQNSRVETMSAAQVTYGVVPVKSFRIPQDQMVLSMEAEDAARAVSTPDQARQFLEDFGSHVSDGVQHLGGIFWKIVEIRTEDMTEINEMETALSKQASNSLSVGYASVVFGGGIATEMHSVEAEANGNGAARVKKTYTMTTKIECTGPNVTNYEMFSQILTHNNQTWFVIDRGVPGSLVSVWDLLMKTNPVEFHRFAALSRMVWLQEAQPLSYISSVERIIKSASTAMWPPDSGEQDVHSCRLLLTDKTSARDSVKMIVVQTCSLKIDHLSADQLLSAVSYMLWSLVRVDDEFDLNLVVDCMREPELPAFLLKVVLHHDKSKVAATTQFLATMFSEKYSVQLQRAYPPVHLDPELAQCLIDTKSPSEKAAPMPVHPEYDFWSPPVLSDVKQLPLVLQEIADSHLSSPNPDFHLLTRKMGETLSVNLWNARGQDSERRDKLLDVAKGYFCTEDGFDEPLNATSVHDIISNLKKAADCSSTPATSHQDSSTGSGILDQMQPLRLIPKWLGVKPYLDESRQRLPYSYLFVDRPRPNLAQDMQACILHALKHRLDIQTELYIKLNNATHSQEGSSGGGRIRRSRAAATESRNNATVQKKGIFDEMSALLSSLSVSARTEILRLLLDRRFLVPFLVPTLSNGGGQAIFHLETATLQFVQTTIAHDGETSVAASLSNDCSRMRVAVVSDRPKHESSTKDWISSIFHVQSFHCLDRDNNCEATKASTTAELGWGFLLDKDKNVYVPVMVLHVIGDYTPLVPFIQEFADAVVVDAGESSSSKVKLSHGSLLKWTCRDPDVDDVQEQEEPVFIASLRCTTKTSALRISEYLLEEVEISEKRGARAPLSDIQRGELIYDDHVPRFDLDCLKAAVDFSTLRRDKLILQRHFVKESRLHIEQLSETNRTDLRVLQNRIEKCQNSRVRDAMKVGQNELVAHLMFVMAEQDTDARVTGILDFQRWLFQNCEETANLKRADYRRALESFRLDTSTLNRKNLDESLEEWSMSAVGMEHLWRELSHLYTADPNGRSNLADMAAQHLLDGFSLELMDGDAAMMNMKWIQGVLNSVRKKIPSSARVLVLSVMGVQSSGKSTLLNYMFGVRLRTSVSRCTRGVSMQLLECRDRKEYDYIILMDSEGLRAPEYIGQEDSVWRDNRMATFAVLPADATIILTKGESTDTINEILPIVLSVHLESELAQQNGGQLPSKLFFMFNQIDMSEKSNMENIVNKLMEQLNKNAEMVDETRRHSHFQNREENLKSSVVLINDFKVNINDEENSDVRILGNIKGQSFAPHDVPFADYGTRLLTFREHLHRRVCDGGRWKAKSVKDFEQYLSLVWDCIQHASFHLNFKAAFEHMNYDKLTREFIEFCQKMASHYAVTFDTLCTEIHERAQSSMVVDPSQDVTVSVSAVTPARLAGLTTEYREKMSGAMNSHIADLNKAMKSTLENKSYEKWETDTLHQWEQKKLEQETHWRLMIEEQVDVAFMYDYYVKQYENTLRVEANKLLGNGGWEKYTADQQNELFEVIFKRLVDDADSKHPPFHKEVHKKINDVFRQCQYIPWPPKCQYHKQQKTEGCLSKFTNYFQSSRKQTQEELEAMLENSINGKVQSILSSAKQYSDKVVFECIDVTWVALLQAENTMRVGHQFKEQVFDNLFNNLTSSLRDIQMKWDKNNSVSVRFRSSKEHMKDYFILLGKGCQAADFLISTISSWIENNFAASFRQELTEKVGHQLKDERWVSDPEVMQAQVDGSLLDMIESARMKEVITSIHNPKAHYDEVISKLIQSKIDASFKTVLDGYLSTLRVAIIAAADVASSRHEGRAKTFLLSLRRTLSARPANCLLVNIPNENDNNANCDGQPSEIFADNDAIPNVRNAVLSKLKSVAEKCNISTDRLVSDVRKYITDRAYGANDGIMPRCGEPCPICRCPCTQSFGHERSNPQKCHDTYHQPGGLTGGHDINTKELVSGSCATYGKTKEQFRHNEKWVYFSDFQSVFPEWDAPVIRRPLPLREFIFMKYQGELVKYFGDVKPCRDIPPSYNHSLETIKNRINELIGSSR